jgi:hypothetical protein
MAAAQGSACVQVKDPDVRCAMNIYVRRIVYHIGEVGWGRDHLNTLVATALANFAATFGGQQSSHDEFIKYIMDHYAKRPGAHASAHTFDV